MNDSDFSREFDIERAGVKVGGGGVLKEGGNVVYELPDEDAKFGHPLEYVVGVIQAAGYSVRWHDAALRARVDELEAAITTHLEGLFDVGDTHVSVLATAERELARLRRLETRRFPLLDGPTIPWALIEPWERQAKENHGQTLEQLAERGGLSSVEAVCVLEGRRFTRDDQFYPLALARTRIAELVREWERR
jgi:hypothetical protein